LAWRNFLDNVIEEQRAPSGLLIAWVEVLNRRLSNGQADDDEEESNADSETYTLISESLAVLEGRLGKQALEANAASDKFVVCSSVLDCTRIIETNKLPTQP
jgi:hypothetical protein